MRASAFAIAVVVIATGWIGGDVLVYHSGVAVKAAADGALAPPTIRRGRPSDLLDSMGELRASWAAVDTRIARMIANGPRADDFEIVAGEAARVEHRARWIAAEGHRTLEGADRPSRHTPHESGEEPASDEDEHGIEEDGVDTTRGQHLTLVSEILETRAAALRRDARKKDLPALATGAGRIDQLCVGCHEELRWGAQRSRRRETATSSRSSSGQP